MAMFPVTVTFHGLNHSAAVEAGIREHAAQLDRFCHLIMGCHVTVEVSHRQHNKGSIFHVRVHLTVPGSEITVSRDPAEHHEHEDVYVAIRDAFNAAERKLEDYMRRRRAQVKRRRSAMRMVETLVETQRRRQGMG